MLFVTKYQTPADLQYKLVWLYLAQYDTFKYSHKLKYVPVGANYITW
jgi:hypothetical protein